MYLLISQMEKKLPERKQNTSIFGLTPVTVTLVTGFSEEQHTTNILRLENDKHPMLSIADFENVSKLF